ncbi:MAG: rhodanese-like domain-containing protein [Gallionellaceae bacterium]|jgi:rhodanese-related sulfurtransferase
MNVKHFLGLSLALSMLPLVAVHAGDIDPATVPASKQVTNKNYLSAKEAAAMKEKLGNKALMIDVRTQAEVEYVGEANPVDYNIPYMVNDYNAWDEKNGRYQMSPNSGFLSKLSDIMHNKGMNKNSTVILMCRSGDRSASAANLMIKDGYKNVYSVEDGFEGDLAKDGAHKGQRMVNGWKNSGLPWTYKISKKIVYLD